MTAYHKSLAIKIVFFLRVPYLTASFRDEDRHNIFSKIRDCDTIAVKQYLSHGGNPDAVGHVHMKISRTECFTMQWSLLCEAASCENVDIFALLATAAGLQNIEKMSKALWIACRLGNDVIAQWLLEHTSVHPWHCNVNPMVSACENGHFNVVRLLCSHEASELHDINVTNASGEGMLHMVLMRSRNDGRMALHIAVEKGDKRKIKQLLQDGHNVNEQDNNGMTPLHIACELGREDVAYYLVYQDADMDIKNFFGQSAYDIAIKSKFYLLAKYLAQSMNSPDAQDDVNPAIADNTYNTLATQPYIGWRDILKEALQLITHGVLSFFRTDPIKVFQVSGKGCDFLDAKQFAKLVAKLLNGMWFGKHITRMNMLGYFDQMLRRQAIRATSALQKGNKRSFDTRCDEITKALILLRKLYADCNNNESEQAVEIASLSESPTIYSRTLAFFCVCVRRIKRIFLRRPSNQLTEWKLIDDDESLQKYRQLTNDIKLVKNYMHWCSYNEKAARKLGCILDDDTKRADDTKRIDSNSNATTFTKSDAAELLLTLAIIRKENVDGTDLDGIYYTWAAFFIFLAGLAKSESS